MSPGSPDLFVVADIKNKEIKNSPGSVLTAQEETGKSCEHGRKVGAAVLS